MGRLHVSVQLTSGKRTTKDTHKLVCLAFHGTPKKKQVCSHLDRDILNNRPDNLLWETQAENLRRRMEHGTHDRGPNNSRALLSHDKVEEMRDLLQQSAPMSRSERVHAGLTRREIGERFGVSRVFVSKMAIGYRYPQDKKLT